MDFEYNERGQIIAPCDVCGKKYPLAEMKHYGGEQFLVEQSYHCRPCEDAIAAELRHFAREQHKKWYGHYDD